MRGPGRGQRTGGNARELLADLEEARLVVRQHQCRAGQYIDPALGQPRKFLGLLHAADTEHGLLVLAAVAYAALRFVEAYGLWFMRGWARWLGIFSAGIYVPFELYYFIRTPSLTSASVMAINLAVLWLLWPNSRPTQPPQLPGLQ